MSRPADWEPCSDSSLRRGDPLDGSGSRGLRWLMVELAGPWGYSALLDSPGLLPPELGREIAGRAQGGIEVTLDLNAYDGTVVGGAAAP